MHRRVIRTFPPLPETHVKLTALPGYTGASMGAASAETEEAALLVGGEAVNCDQSTESTAWATTKFLGSVL